MKEWQWVCEYQQQRQEQKPGVTAPVQISYLQDSVSTIFKSPET